MVRLHYFKLVKARSVQSEKRQMSTGSGAAEQQESPGNKKSFRIWTRAGRWSGLTQMTVVESALCPLDRKTSLQRGLRHESHFYFHTANGQRKKAKVEVTSAYGLSPNDEFYLWGLLALTFAQENPEPVFYATPHYCLRQLGVLDDTSKRGGKNYRDFRQVLKRLGGVTYWCDAFYDPVRAERGERIFHFLSCDRPLDPKSSRAWRIVWDKLFFEFVGSDGGHFAFDLATYRDLDPASRRLFLLLRKVFHRRRRVRFRLRELAVDQLGYTSDRPDKKLKASIKQCLEKLLERGIVALGKAHDINKLFQKNGSTEWVSLYRGPYFEKKAAQRSFQKLQESAVYEPLHAIGFADPDIGFLVKQYPASLLQQWADITLAARERFGASFFKKSEQAYFRDNVNAAAVGKRTPPDWWIDVRREEEHQAWAKAAAKVVGKDKTLSPEKQREAFSAYLCGEGRSRFSELMGAAFGEYRQSGQADHVARREAERYAKSKLWKEFTEAGAAEIENVLRFAKN